MQGSTKIPITDLNAHITCKICNGYFVDASTIIECLHTCEYSVLIYNVHYVTDTVIIPQKIYIIFILIEI